MNNTIRNLLVLTFFISKISFAQKKLQILKANSPVLSIMEENFLYQDIWTASSEVKLDVFVPNRFDKEKRITFYSDIDSLSIIVKPNKKYDFIILLNEKDKAYTQINTFKNKIASLEPKLIYKRKNNLNLNKTDTINFEIGKNNGIHIKGKINNSEDLDFYFDTGAGMNVITTSLINTKVKLKIDGNIENKGSDGTSINNTSSNNQFEIGNLIWDKVKLLSTDYKNLPFDVVLSWTAFETKIIEINYDAKELIIHETIGKIPNEYSKSEIKMIDGIPYIMCKLVIDGKTTETWFILDSGSDGNLIIGNKLASDNLIKNKLENLGNGKSKGSTGIEFMQTKVLLPKLQVGNFELYNVPMRINEEDPINSSHNEIIGNNILKRFNTIIDFQNNIIYLKPNKLFYTTLE